MLRPVELCRLPAGRHHDSQGLFLRVSPQGSRSWIYRYMKDKRSHEIGLGAFPAISLKEARVRRNQAMAQRNQGLDPLMEKKKEAAGPLRSPRENVPARCRGRLRSQEAGTLEPKICPAMVGGPCKSRPAGLGNRYRRYQAGPGADLANPNPDPGKTVP